MAAVKNQLPETVRAFNKKRKFEHGRKPMKRIEAAFDRGTGAKYKNNNNRKMQKPLKRSAKENKSDVDEGAHPGAGDPNDSFDDLTGDSSEEEGSRDWNGLEDEEEGSSQDEGDGGMQQHGIAKFTQGSRAFKMAFTKIMKKNALSEPLGPVLSAHKKLVAGKLAEEVEEQKAKGEAKKEKHLAGEKGHAKPANFLDSKEKSLISIATKGVVKLFNAVNKSQNPQKGLNPSRFKDAKELAKRRKETFFSELRKSTSQASDNPTKVIKSTKEENSDEPGWAPLRDSYMLTSSKLKDWDKMQESTGAVEPEKLPLESSSDEE